MKFKTVMPTEKEQVEFDKPGEVAGGIPAVVSSFKEGISEMGLKPCVKTFLQLNQVNGFDCPSCAWPDPRPEDRSSIAEFCENGAKAVAEEGTQERADPKFWKNHSIETLLQWPEHRLGKAGRITHPMILKAGATHYEPVSWEKAFSLMASKLKSLSSPDEAIFYTSGRTSNEAAFLYQLFVRAFGTNNLPDCSNMCHESTSVGLRESIGFGKGSVRLEDFYVADLIMIIGQNPGTNHPRMMSALQKAKRKGAKIISINPLPETGLMSFKNPQELKGWVGTPTELSDLFLQVKINGDIALIKAILYVLYQLEKERPGEIFDQDFIKNYTTGYDDLVADLSGQDLSKLAEQCGVAESEIIDAADLISRNKKMIICWAMGVTQHENGVANIKEIVNLLLLRGSIGIPGAGACPVRGHSNVQGDRTMGIWEKLDSELARNLKKNFSFDPPMKDGYDVVGALNAMHQGKASFFMSMGGNLLLASPDTNYTAEAMRRCDLTVMVSTKPNRNHLVTGKTALILPCLGRTEEDIRNGEAQFVTTENSMGIVQASKGKNKPASPHLLSEPEIVARLAMATLENNPSIDWQHLISHYDHTRNAIESCIAGFNDYNTRVRNAGGFYLPNGPSTRTFPTDDKKAHFTVVPVPVWQLEPDEFLMTTIRSHDQFNTTIYGYQDRYRGIKHGRRVVMMHPEDIRQAGFHRGDTIDIINTHGGVLRTAENFTVMPYQIPQGCIATFYPEANVLVPIDQFAEKARTPASKSVVVRLKKAYT